MLQDHSVCWIVFSASNTKRLWRAIQSFEWTSI